MLLIALLVRLESSGPAFFVQERLGYRRRPFPCIKFRTMRDDAERETGPVWAAEEDPRITPLGRWLRKYSLDELPQFWHVLRGDMSLVGPRPPVPSEVERYETWQRRRLSMRPGLTCLWQISGRNEIDFQTWMELDLEYIDTWTFGLDLRILLRTVPAVLFGRGAR